MPINAAAIKIFFIPGNLNKYRQSLCHRDAIPPELSVLNLCFARVRFPVIGTFAIMKCRSLIFASLLFILPFSSRAWGTLGHRITGQIAETYLTPSAKRAIRQLLGHESLAMASNWADFIRSDSSYNFLSSWHYINMPAGLSPAGFHDFLTNDTSTDLYTRLNFVVSQLRIRSLDKAKKTFYLKLLIHLAGDAHQPMHASHAEDNGGNKFRVQWFGAPTNMHRLWDEDLINFQQLSYTEYAQAINYPAPAQIKQWQQQPIGDWIHESYDLAEAFYAEVKPDDKLGYPYNFHHLAILNERLLKGGIRLAGLLNSIFAGA